MMHMSKISEHETTCSLQYNNELFETFLTVKEIAKILQVSNDTVYRLLDERKLSFYFFGRCKKISITDLMDFLTVCYRVAQ